MNLDNPKEYAVWAVEQGFLTSREYLERGLDKACELAREREQQFVAQQTREPASEHF